MDADHKIWAGADSEDDERWRWECSCGAAGSSPVHQVDIAKTQHIKNGETRVDTSRRPG